MARSRHPAPPTHPAAPSDPAPPTPPRPARRSRYRPPFPAPILRLPAGRFRPRHCPNLQCRFYEPHPDWRYSRWGVYRAPSCRQPIPRFQCRHCRRTFTARTFAATYWLHRFDLFALIVQDIGRRFRCPPDRPHPGNRPCHRGASPHPRRPPEPDLPPADGPQDPAVGTGGHRRLRDLRVLPVLSLPLQPGRRSRELVPLPLHRQSAAAQRDDDPGAEAAPRRTGRERWAVPTRRRWKTGSSSCCRSCGRRRRRARSRRPAETTARRHHPATPCTATTIRPTGGRCAGSTRPARRKNGRACSTGRRPRPPRAPAPTNSSRVTWPTCCSATAGPITAGRRSPTTSAGRAAWNGWPSSRSGATPSSGAGRTTPARPRR